MDEGPAMVITPKPTSTPNISFKKAIEQEKEIYEINLETNDGALIISIKNINDDIVSGEYLKKLSIEEIQRMHTGLSILNTVDEFVDYLKELIESKEIKFIKEEGKKTLSIEIFVYFLKKKESVKIECQKNKVDNEKIFDTFIKEINKLKQEVKALKNENESLKKEVKNCQNFQEELFKKFPDFYEILETMKKEKIKEENKNKESVLIEKPDELKMLLNEISKKTNKNATGIRKLFRATENGDKVKQMNKACKDIKGTVVIAKCDQRRFGGYTSKIWDGSGETIDDNTCFMFSLDKMKIYPFTNNGFSITSYFDGCFAFGRNNDLFIEDNFLSSKKSYTNQEELDECSFDFFGDKTALTNVTLPEKINFSECEILQVIFD